jgi:hypothetical protein
MGPEMMELLLPQQELLLPQQEQLLPQQGLLLPQQALLKGSAAQPAEEAGVPPPWLLFSGACEVQDCLQLFTAAQFCLETKGIVTIWKNHYKPIISISHT